MISVAYVNFSYVIRAVTNLNAITGDEKFSPASISYKQVKFLKTFYHDNMKLLDTVVNMVAGLIFLKTHVFTLLHNVR
jgi:hypothetical protein